MWKKLFQSLGVCLALAAACVLLISTAAGADVAAIVEMNRNIRNIGAGLSLAAAVCSIIGAVI